MDRPIPPEIERQQRLRRVLKIVVPIVLIAVVIAALPGWIRPSVSRSRIRTAIVTTRARSNPSSPRRGQSCLKSSACYLEPARCARAAAVLKRPGTSVEQGEPVVELDVSQSVLTLEKVLKTRSSKDNQQAQTRLALEKSLRRARRTDRAGRRSNWNRLTSRSEEPERRLFDEGLVSRDALRQADLDVKQADGRAAAAESLIASTRSCATDLQFHRPRARARLYRQGGRRRRGRLARSAPRPSRIARAS